MVEVKAMLARSDCLHPGFSAILQGRSISSLCKKKKKEKREEIIDVKSCFFSNNFSALHVPRLLAD